MWLLVADFILRFRIPLLVGVLALACYMGYVGLTRAEFSQEFVSVIPAEDPDAQDFQRFRALFGEDAGTLLVGLEGRAVYAKDALNDLWALSQELKQDTNVQRVVNVTQAVRLDADLANQRFDAVAVMPGPMQTQAQADSLRDWFLAQPFLKGLLFSEDREVTVFAVAYSDRVMASRHKHNLIRHTEGRLNELADRHGFRVHYTGLPYLRYYVAKELPRELAIFSGFALLFTAISLFLFYRSLYSVVFPLVLLLVSSLCTLGIVGLFGYKVTILMGMLPPVIIILGIPPSIYMLSDYHEEYVQTGNKFEALRRMVRKLGFVTLMINANTAFGFLTLYFTEVKILQQFGIVAFLGTMLAYFLTIILIPGVYSLLPPPTKKNVRHLHAPRINGFVGWARKAVQRQRRAIYWATGGLVAVSVVGFAKLVPEAFVVDDIPKDGVMFNDFHKMQDEFGGVLPFEVLVDTRQAEGATKLKWLRQVEGLQTALARHPEISRTLSVTDVVKWGRQALAGGDTSQFQLPIREEYDVLQLFGQNTRTAARLRQDSLRAAKPPAGPLNNPVGNAALSDTSGRIIRITGFVRDVGSLEMPRLLARIQHDADSVFGIRRATPISPGADSLPPILNPDDVPNITLTGTTRIFLKSNDYLLDNLVGSLVAAFLIIGLQMLLLFNSWRVMLISMIPNLIPLGITAGIMGLFGIPLKPSTALIFEMAFGIAIDNSIHYLAIYRYFRRKDDEVPAAVGKALKTTGLGIVYTSIVLFMGFIIFVPSAFGSTSNLGILTSVTLFIALFSNLLLMPALLINFDRRGKLKDKALIDEEAGEGIPAQPLPEQGMF